MASAGDPNVPIDVRHETSLHRPAVLRSPARYECTRAQVVFIFRLLAHARKFLAGASDAKREGAVERAGDGGNGDGADDPERDAAETEEGDEYLDDDPDDWEMPPSPMDRARYGEEEAWRRQRAWAVDVADAARAVGDAVVERRAPDKLLRRRRIELDEHAERSAWTIHQDRHDRKFGREQRLEQRARTRRQHREAGIISRCGHRDAV